MNGYVASTLSNASHGGDCRRFQTRTIRPECGGALRAVLHPAAAGFVPNVVFPTGVVADGDGLLVYYGAADSVTAVAEFNRGDFLVI